MTTRGFEIVSKYQNEDLTLPQRSTFQAAGYDFEAAQDIVISSIIHQDAFRKLNPLALTRLDKVLADPSWQEMLKPVLIPTGIKAYMGAGEYLQLVARSSAPIKKRMMMPNGVGVVDADYYDNTSNEGEIFFQYINFGLQDVHIKKGERIGQGIFLPYLLADNDQTIPKAQRQGGFGSTGEY
ncbi:dCTP deaminase/dUTPase family protein [Convivina praedatoris]|uniref:dUTP diphosphatase n=1 Tax=Convivina praedatoris TaxID=2880963 RepID=A0ABN8HHE9_9LACO|nr:deoxyuridine 5'-triphosphate nucleotidohydrolase [Convivina sp. LMG 32447]CAH1855340.1 Deoxyuridine 5'-triphosphate nucleotidohydrolase [Convivina sp. LMG 32447]CAH1856004.1 Deoxyuridine 5'-triphosphate nucleotidohydrolase [Convivina sp. LMG 32447]CAH1856396.1 Deoxyuridine 5'-triphosphate nucleotidohydrolase [Convivina sp. LMG 32447]